MCHPGYADEALRRLDRVVATREQELRFLLSPLFRETIRRRGLAPARLAPARLAEICPQAPVRVG